MIRYMGEEIGLREDKCTGGSHKGSKKLRFFMSVCHWLHLLLAKNSDKISLRDVVK